MSNRRVTAFFVFCDSSFTENKTKMSKSELKRRTTEVIKEDRQSCATCYKAGRQTQGERLKAINALQTTSMNLSMRMKGMNIGAVASDGR